MTSTNFEAVMPVIAELLETGTRAFALSNWDQAIDKFGELSSLTEQTFGSESQRYADSLVMYGRALLERAIEQSALLAQKTLAEAATGITASEEQKAESTKKSNINFEGEPDFGQLSSSKGKEVDTSAVNEEEPEENAEGEEEEEEEEEDGFAAAWEVLDVARVIQSKATESKAQLKYAETLMLLGDVSMESENFPQAVDDFTAALEVKMQYLGDDSRELAELYYKVALAHEYNQNNQRALELMDEVKRILNKRLENLKDSDKKEDQEDVKSLKEVLEDVEAKIEEWKNPAAKVDLNAMTPKEAELAEKAKAMFKEAFESGKINDLTGLVRQQKKPQQQQQPESSTSNGNGKRSKPEEKEEDQEEEGSKKAKN